MRQFCLLGVGKWLVEFHAHLCGCVVFASGVFGCFVGVVYYETVLPCNLCYRSHRCSERLFGFLFHSGIDGKGVFHHLAFVAHINANTSVCRYIAHALYAVECGGYHSLHLRFAALLDFVHHRFGCVALLVRDVFSA